MIDETHFKDIYRFIVGLTFFGALLSLLTIFVDIPKENQRFADTAVIFWLSTAVSGGIGYLIGNSANINKRKDGQTVADTVIQTGDITSK